MGLEGARKKNVWGNGEDARGNFAPESFAEGDEAELDHLGQSFRVPDAANEPGRLDTVARSSGRGVIVPNEKLIDELSEGLDLAEQQTGFADTVIDQEETIETLYRGSREENLARVKLVEGETGAGGEIPGNIRKVSIAKEEAIPTRGQAITGIRTGFSSKEIQAQTKAAGGFWNRFRKKLGLD